MAARKKAKAKLAKPKGKSLRNKKTLFLSRMNTGSHAQFEVFTDKGKALRNAKATLGYEGESAVFDMCYFQFRRATGITFPKGQAREITIIVGPPLKQPREKKVKKVATLEPTRALSFNAYDEDEDRF